jgi:hypothetical protein
VVPSFGKSALIERTVTSARDFRVLRTAGREGEIELAFAALQQLCAPALHRLERLPELQRDALGVVFGVSSGDPPDRLLVALAVLTLLSELAAERPLLCVVDDAQWLDRASAQAVAFVARRLANEPVAFLFGARELPDEVRGLPLQSARNARLRGGGVGPQSTSQGIVCSRTTRCRDGTSRRLCLPGLATDPWSAAGVTQSAAATTAATA